jgi:predicted acyl esterase
MRKAIFIFVLVLGASACGGIRQPLLEAEYKNDEYGFSIHYPAQYVEAELRGFGEGTSEVLRVGARAGGFPQLVIKVIYMEDDTPFTEIKDIYSQVQLSATGVTDTKFTSEKEVALSDGTPAFELEIEYSAGGYHFKSLNLWIQKYDRWFAVAATTTRASWDRDQAEMKAIVRSFAAPTHDDPNAKEYFTFTRDVPMRDGKTLPAYVLLPAETGPYPVLIWYTQYGARGLRMFLIRSGDTYILFGPGAKSVYGFVFVNTRGRYESKDAWYAGCPTQGEDGADLVEWVASQPWSDKIGMFGWGADGAAVYMTAAENPDGLTAIAPEFSPLLSEDYTRHYPGGVMKEANLRVVTDQWPGSWDELTAHPQWDDWWDERYADAPRAEDITAHITVENGWFAHNVEFGLRNYIALSEADRPFADKTKTVIGPWSHYLNGQVKQGHLEYPKAKGRARAYLRRHFDYWLRGIDDGLYDEPPIHYYQMGEEVWKFTSAWPPPGTRDTQYYLQSTGKLLTTAHAEESEGPSTYIYDPGDPSPAIGGPFLWPSNFFPNPVCGPGYQDSEVLAGRDDYLVYDTPLLTKDLEMAGWPRAKLYIGCDRPDTDVIIRLCDYDPDAPLGKQTLLMAVKPQRMRYRKSLKGDPSWMEPGEVYEVDIKMDPLAYTWKKGHQVRVIVSSSAYPLYALNPNNKDHFIWDEGDPLVAEVKVWSDSRYPSHLILPVAGGRLPE